MSTLIHIIYCSTAAAPMQHAELLAMLNIARLKNAALGITGMLLFTDNSFFQVLEGESDVVDPLFERIKADSRHRQVTCIIRERIPSRDFEQWTMGFADLIPGDYAAIIGTKSFINGRNALNDIEPGRARKLLSAFIQGRWRARLTDDEMPDTATSAPRQTAYPLHHTFAYQPVVQASLRGIVIVAYEALLRGPDGEAPDTVLRHITTARQPVFTVRSSRKAIELAVKCGLSAKLHLNFPASVLRDEPHLVDRIIEIAEQIGLPPRQIVLEILEREIVHDQPDLIEALKAQRSTGISFALDDFGAGYAGLNLLADFQPETVKLDMHLIRNVETDGPRQAIIRGIRRCCIDLGIDLIAEGVETQDEYVWLQREGIDQFQGFFFARPALETLPDVAPEALG